MNDEYRFTLFTKQIYLYALVYIFSLYAYLWSVMKVKSTILKFTSQEIMKLEIMKLWNYEIINNITARYFYKSMSIYN